MPGRGACSESIKQAGPCKQDACSAATYTNFSLIALLVDIGAVFGPGGQASVVRRDKGGFGEPRAESGGSQAGFIWSPLCYPQALASNDGHTEQ